jgi:SanA protein
MIKFLFRLIVGVLIVTIVFTIFCNVLIISQTKSKIYHEVSEVPKREYALVLGTSKRTVKGEANTFFDNRMTAASELYKQGRVKKLLLSGDNRTKYYNEPNDMRLALLKKGVPENVILMDTAGFRTIESVYRCSHVYNQKDVTIITQEFHAFRALYISQYYDMNAIAYLAEEVPIYSAAKVNIREFFARPKAIFDLYLPGKFNE